MFPFWNNFADTASGFPRWAARTYTRNPNLIKALAVGIPPLRRITNFRGMPLTILDKNPTRENIVRALEEGPYGRCVYHCDNDVVDHQVVMMRMSSGPLVTLTMHSHSHYEHRSTRIEGSHGRLMAEFGMGGAWITVDEHRTDWHETFDTSGPLGEGHGGGDFLLMENFVNSLRRDDFEQAYAATRDALESHLMAFAAEESRHGAKVVTREEWQVKSGR
jgi:predicted dehydrogenase